MLSNDMSNNADEFGGQTIPEKIAEQLHGQDTVIVKLTPTSVAPERQRLNVYTSEVYQAILVRLPSRVYEAIMQNESRHQLIAVNFGRGAFFCQVKRSIAAHLLPPLVTHEKKMRIEAADNTIITLVSEVADETVRDDAGDARYRTGRAAGARCRLARCVARARRPARTSRERSARHRDTSDARRGRRRRTWRRSRSRRDRRVTTVCLYRVRL